MQGHLIPKLVSLDHLNKLWAADHQNSGQIQSFLSASSLAGRAAFKRCMIILDLVMEGAQGKLIVELHCVWKSNEQTPAMQLHRSCVWLCYCPQPGEMLLSLVESFEPRRGCIAASY